MSDAWAVVPPLAAIVLCIVTRQVMVSLFLGIWAGGLIAAHGNPFGATAHTFTWMKDVMVDEWNARFLVLNLLLGAGAAFMYKTGGGHAVTRALAAHVHSPRRALLFTWLLGCLVFINDYVNAVITGNATRDITAKYRVSREKLAYVLDTTAAPVATFGPISDWIGYQCSMIAVGFAAAQVTDVKPYAAFLQSIPWNFYCILALFAVPMIILGRDFGPMAQAERRARETGKLVADGDSPLSAVEADLGKPVMQERATIWSFVLPLVTLIAVGVYALWYVGGGPTGKGLMDAFADTDVSIALTWAAFAMMLVGFALALVQGVSLAECERITLGGFRTMLPALAIMVLAWSIGAVCSHLKTAEVVVQTARPWLSPGLLPLLIFGICMFLSFATGTSWGTMAIITPIAVPLAHDLGGLPLVYTIIGTVFAGAIFGDHCSPISDTTVLASTFAGSDHLAHVRTQIPYALVPATLAAVMYLLTPVVRNPFLLLAAALPCQFLLLRWLGSTYERRSLLNAPLSSFES